MFLGKVGREKRRREGWLPEVFYFLLPKWRRWSCRQELISLLTFPTAEHTTINDMIKSTQDKPTVRGSELVWGLCACATYAPTCRRHCSRSHSPCFQTGWLSWSCSPSWCPAADAQATAAAERSSGRWLQTPYWLLEWLPTGPHCPDKREQPDKHLKHTHTRVRKR